MKAFLLLFALVTAAAVTHAETSSDDVDSGPELRAVSIVHGMTFTLNQRELVPGTQGPTTMITRIHTEVPPEANDPGAPPIDLTVRVLAPDMEVGHAAGALAALGLMRGLTINQIAGGFAQLNWGVQITAVKGQVPAAAQVDATRAGALGQLLISAILAGDRPGGGCDAAIPLLQQGAAVLGFPVSCAQQ